MAYGKNTNLDNEESYLRGLIDGGGGNAAWAQNQLGELTAAKVQYTAPESATTGGRAAYHGGSSGYTGGYTGAGDLGYDKDTDYSSYLHELMNQGSDDYDYLRKLLGERETKAVNLGAAQYANDPFAQSVRDYIAKGEAADINRYRDLYSAAVPSAPTYQPSEWDETTEALARAALAMDYDDWTKSDQYAALADRYGYQGRLAMQDTLGQMASRTGGLASSYAVTAAQQGYNNYMAGLEAAARQAFQNERGNAIERAQLARDYSERDYGRYLDELAQYNSDRDYAMDVLGKALSESRYAKEWKTAQEQEQYERERAAQQEQYERDLAKAKTLGSAGDFSGFRALGYSDEEIARLQQAATPTASVGSTGSGRSSGSSGSARASGAAATEDSFWANVEDYAALGGDPADYIKANWKASGLFSSQTAALAAWNVRNTRAGASGTAAGMPESDFNREAQTIMQYLSQRMDDKAQNRINYIWDRLSAAQKQQLKAALAKNGIDIE